MDTDGWAETDAEPPASPPGRARWGDPADGAEFAGAYRRKRRFAA